jgi:hypothetical protein
MVNMKMAPPKEKAVMTAPDPENTPRYPWGLSVHLDDESLEKLGLKDLPTAGTKLSLVARVDVVSVSERQSQDEQDTMRSLELQITDMALGPDEAGEKPKAQDVLYKS